MKNFYLSNFSRKVGKQDKTQSPKSYGARAAYAIAFWALLKKTWVAKQPMSFFHNDEKRHL